MTPSQLRAAILKALREDDRHLPGSFIQSNDLAKMVHNPGVGRYDWPVPHPPSKEEQDAVEKMPVWR